jgi:hypothetical protein
MAADMREVKPAAISKRSKQPVKCSRPGFKDFTAQGPFHEFHGPLGGRQATVFIAARFERSVDGMRRSVPGELRVTGSEEYPSRSHRYDVQFPEHSWAV